MTVWMFTAKSESGDNYGPWVYNKKPTQDQVEAILRRDCEGEWGEDDGRQGPGWRGSWLYVDGPFPVGVEELP